MPWKPTTEQLEKVRESIARERDEMKRRSEDKRRRKRESTTQRKSTKPAKQNRKQRGHSGIARTVPRLSILKATGFADYDEYLKSDLWKSIRRRVFARDQSKCLLCGSAASQVHHIEYTEENLCGGNMAWMISVCRGCHVGIHFDGDRYRGKAESKGIVSSALKGRFPWDDDATSEVVGCRVCGKTKSIGRESICLPCYKKHRWNVHRLAQKRDRENALEANA